MWKSLERWPVLLALLVALSGLAVALLCLPYGSRVTPENCERIKVSMSEAEVLAILGKPWDDSLLDPDTNFREPESGTITCLGKGYGASPSRRRSQSRSFWMRIQSSENQAI
jgi:hypothetical protein